MNLLLVGENNCTQFSLKELILKKKKKKNGVIKKKKKVFTFIYFFLYGQLKCPYSILINI